MFLARVAIPSAAARRIGGWTGRSTLLGSTGLMDFSDSVCTILRTATRGKNTVSYGGSLTLNWGVVADQSESLSEGANDIANPADFGVTVDFVDVSL